MKASSVRDAAGGCDTVPTRSSLPAIASAVCSAHPPNVDASRISTALMLRGRVTCPPKSRVRGLPVPGQGQSGPDPRTGSIRRGVLNGWQLTPPTQGMLSLSTDHQIERDQCVDHPRCFSALRLFFRREPAAKWGWDVDEFWWRVLREPTLPEGLLLKVLAGKVDFRRVTPSSVRSG